MLFTKTILPILLLIVKAEPKKHEEAKWGDTYDFVIVGGGTAGSVLAARLSEVKKWNILLLEAGNEPSAIAKLPTAAPLLQMTALNWRYLSQPQDDIFKGLNQGQMLWSSGKALGGSSALSYMMYTRGNREDYDNWEKMENKGWAFKDVLPYFLKSEKAPDLAYADKASHGMTGPLNVEHSYHGESCATFFKAAKEMGYNVTDYNGKDQLGFSILQANMKGGARQTTYNAYLGEKRTNLEVVKGARVDKINLIASGNKAKAVKFVANGKKYRAVASIEIILCAGAFNSPQLLMLSGIGPKEHLKELGIPLVKDLPVGKSLRDHVTYPALNFLTNSRRTSFDIMKENVRDLYYWFFIGKGISTNLGGFEAVSYVKLPGSPPGQKRPDVELLFHESIMSSALSKVINMKEEVYDKLYNNTAKRIVWSIYPVLLHPKSKGVVQLQSKNPSDEPLLYAKYFSDKDDMKMMVDAIKLVLKMTQTKEFKKLNTVLNPNPVPGCERHRKGSDAYWECAVRSLGVTAYDQFGSCKMGPKDDQEAVVDPKLKVHGVANLRVVDASVIPGTVSGHLFAATVMVAERAADFIKEAHNKTTS